MTPPPANSRDYTLNRNRFNRFAIPCRPPPPSPILDTGCSIHPTARLCEGDPRAEWAIVQDRRPTGCSDPRTKADDHERTFHFGHKGKLLPGAEGRYSTFVVCRHHPSAQQSVASPPHGSEGVRPAPGPPVQNARACLCGGGWVGIPNSEFRIPTFVYSIRTGVGLTPATVLRGNPRSGGASS
jgi:hypothetical protein